MSEHSRKLETLRDQAQILISRVGLREDWEKLHAQLVKLYGETDPSPELKWLREAIMTTARTVNECSCNAPCREVHYENLADQLAWLPSSDVDGIVREASRLRHRWEVQREMAKNPIIEGFRQWEEFPVGGVIQSREGEEFKADLIRADYHGNVRALIWVSDFNASLTLSGCVVLDPSGLIVEKKLVNETGQWMEDGRAWCDSRLMMVAGGEE